MYKKQEARSASNDPDESGLASKQRAIIGVSRFRLQTGHCTKQPEEDRPEAQERERLRVLLADDFEPWRISMRSLLQEQPDLEVVDEAVDGVEAVEKARALQPDLILLDVAMPKLNGIEAATRIHEIAPWSAILFVSMEQSVDFVEAAMATGACGYIFKADVPSKLLPAIRALQLKK